MGIGGGGDFIQKLHFLLFPKNEMFYHGIYRNTSGLFSCNAGKPNQNFPLKITFGVLMKYLNQRIK